MPMTQKEMQRGSGEALLYNVALDKPYAVDGLAHHDPDFVYLVWLSHSDADRLRTELGGKVSLWRAGVMENVEHMIETAKDLRAEEEEEDREGKRDVPIEDLF